jgi:predicted RNA-binding Zn-ribbon protein involved in translation (DUF1610 family)
MTLERLIRQLVTVLESRDPSGLHRPVPVADLRRQVLPYRVHRPALGLSSSEDYELLVLRLVAEEDGWVRTFPPEAAERARRELSLSMPDPDLTESLGDATIQIGAPALARLKSTAAPSAPPPEPTESETAPAAAPPAPDEEEQEEWAPPPEPAPPPPPPPLPLFERLDAPDPSDVLLDRPTEEPSADAEPEVSCTGCGSLLPVGRIVVYCPQCGRQVGARRCRRCESVLEPGWRHCVMCGHQAPDIDSPVA